MHSLEQLFKLHVDKVGLFEADDFMQHWYHCLQLSGSAISTTTEKSSTS